MKNLKPSKRDALAKNNKRSVGQLVTTFIQKLSSINSKLSGGVGFGVTSTRYFDVQSGSEHVDDTPTREDLLKFVKVIIFDLDLTLIDSFKLASKVYEAVAKRYYPELKIDDYDKRLADLWGAPNDEVLLRYYDETEDALEKLHKYISDELHHNKVEPIDGAVEIVNKAYDAGYHLAVLTASTSRTLKWKLEDAGFDISKFELLQGSEETTHHKPDPRVFDPQIKFFKKKGIYPDEMLYIGDAVRDFKAAHGAGVNFIAVLTGFDDAQAFKQAGVPTELIIPSVAYLPIPSKRSQ